MGAMSPTMTRAVVTLVRGRDAGGLEGQRKRSPRERESTRHAVVRRPSGLVGDLV